LAYGTLNHDENLHRESVIHSDGEYVGGDAHVNTCESHASRATVALAASRCFKRQTHSISQTGPTSATNPPQTGSRNIETFSPGRSLTYQQYVSSGRFCFSTILFSTLTTLHPIAR
jgi:hypothetical protein